jgi:hypothetical protein
MQNEERQQQKHLSSLFPFFIRPFFSFHFGGIFIFFFGNP